MKMAHKSEAIGLTSALKQVYYIHKSVVADLTSKNQILAEECKKLKNQLKQSASSSSTEPCHTCHRLKQLNRSLQKALVRRDTQKEKDSPSQKERCVDKSHPRKRLSDHMFGTPGVPHNEDGNLRQMDPQKKRKSLPPQDCLDLTCDDDVLNESELHPLELSMESGDTESRNSTVLAPETEMVNSAWKVPKIRQRKGLDKISEARGAGNISLELEDNEAQSQKILAVPETMNLDDVVDVNKNGLENDGFQSGDCDEKSASSDEENLEPNPSIPHRVTTQLRSEDGAESSAVKKKRMDTENETDTSALDSGVGQKNVHRPEKPSDLELKVDQQKENQMKHAWPIKVSKNSGIVRFLTAKAGNTARKATETKSVKHSNQHETELSNASPVRSLGKTRTPTSAGVFKMPQSSPQTTAFKKPDSGNIIQNTSNEESIHFPHDTKTHCDKSKQDLKSPAASTYVPNDDHFSNNQHVKSKKAVDCSPGQLVKPPASMDETIAPSLLNRHRLNESVSFATPGPQTVAVGWDSDQSSQETAPLQQSSTLQPSVKADSSPPEHGHGKSNSNRSPGGKRSLKLNKSETGSRLQLPDPRLTVREVARGRAPRSESFPSQNRTTGTKVKDLFGENSLNQHDSDSDLSDDSDLSPLSDQDEETIAPSPQASLQGASFMPYQSVPSSSTSYKFVNKKSCSPHDWSSKMPSFQREGLYNDPAHPILLDEDVDDVDVDNGDDKDVVDVDVDSSDEEDRQTSTQVEVGFRTSTLKDNDDGLQRSSSLEESFSGGDDCEDAVSDKPENPAAKERDFEDSFDRVPREAQVEIAFVEVVRKKSERDKLEGFSCKQCHEYYKNSGLSEEELKKKMKECSRHKERYRRPDTPEHFWTLGFPDTAEILDRQKSSDHRRATPVNAEKRPRRKRQLEMKF